MKKILFLVAVCVLLLTINNLVHTIYTLWQKQYLVVAAQQELERQKAENKKLKAQLTVVNSPSFIEQQARDKLLLVKKGESTVILPPGTQNTDAPAPASKPQLANWQQWLRLF